MSVCSLVATGKQMDQLSRNLKAGIFTKKCRRTPILVENSTIIIGTLNPHSVSEWGTDWVAGCPSCLGHGCYVGITATTVSTVRFVTTVLWGDPQPSRQIWCHWRHLYKSKDNFWRQLHAVSTFPNLFAHSNINKDDIFRFLFSISSAFSVTQAFQSASENFAYQYISRLPFSEIIKIFT